MGSVLKTVIIMKSSVKFQEIQKQIVPSLPFVFQKRQIIREMIVPYNNVLLFARTQNTFVMAT